MGAVWLARDTVLGRDVALKRIGLIPGATTPDLQRAEREARLAARLNHPHVVAIYDLVADEGENWLVMEYVEGITLAALIRNDGALQPDEAAGLVRQAADALTAAHAAGIVHRDVKPSNMLVTRDGDVKLTDFGIARAEADASLTRTGLVTGSPAYLAPEVASGSSATEASDVWSLGATLFHALAGRPPYDVDENVMGALYRIVHEEPPRLPDAGWLAPVLAHTMARDPADRWTMTEVRDHLARGDETPVHPTPVVPAPVGDGTRVLAPPPARPVPVRRPWWPWLAAAVLVLAVVVLGYVALSTRDDGSTGAGSSTPPRSSPPSSPASSPTSGKTQSSGPSDGEQARAMKAFLTTYLATVTSDRHAAWQMLTPSYQAASGGFGGYSGFWSSIKSARASNLTADPGAMTVTYDVAYEKANGQHVREHHTLQLVRDGSSFLIDGQLS
jgi:serine/threonine protein kinase